MKSIVLAILALAAVVLSNAEDDGQYRPSVYGGDDGSYQPSDEGRYIGSHDRTYKVYTPLDHSYKSLIARNGKYDSIYSAYEPVYVKAYNPYQQLLTPFVNYGDRNSFDQDPFASSVAAVTYRPPVVPVVSTVTPVVYASTPHPVVYASTPKSIVYASTPKPVIYASTPKPFVYTTPIKPIVYSATAKPVVPASVYAHTKNAYEGYARIIKQDQEVDPNAYKYSYETENGISAGETGVVGNASGGGTKARGFYEYIGDNGLKYRVDYNADENGFRASGAHLPQK